MSDSSSNQPGAEASAIKVITVVSGGERHQFDHMGDETLIQAADDASINLPSSCRSGYCGTCVARIVEGKVRIHENHNLGGQEFSEGYILVCQAIPITETVTIEYDF